MPTINLGKVRPNYRGEYSNITTYNSMDSVYSGSATYICHVDGTVGQNPDGGANWTKTLDLPTENSSTHTDFEARREMNRRQYAVSGFVEFGKANTSGSHRTKINNGLTTNENLPNILEMGLRGGSTTDTDKNSKTDYPILLIDGVQFNVFGITDDDDSGSFIRLPEAPTARAENSTTTTQSTDKYEFVVTGNQAYVCIAPAPSGTLLTNTTYFEPRGAVSREDLVGFEAFLVELGSNGVDAVYPNGLVQNGLTTYEGQTLSNTVMPQGYSAFGEHDTTTTGYGKQWSTMSVLERDAWLNDPANNIYVKDRSYYQWQGRMRSIRGLGNDWEQLKSWDIANHLQYDTNNRIAVQATSTTPTEFTDFASPHFVPANSVNATSNDTGVFSIRSSYAPIVTGGECYFLPICTVTRRNQGAYHQFLNELGTRNFKDFTLGNAAWYSSDATDVATCFRQGDTGVQTGYNVNTGDISSGTSGRPDGKFYDAIYEGDVTDLRLPARPVNKSLNELAQAYVSNQMRGVEGLPMLHLPVTATATSTSASSGAFQISDTSSFEVGGYITLVDSSDIVVINRAKITNIVTNSTVIWDNNIQSYTRTSGQDYTAIQETESTIKFAILSEKGIIATPANLTTLMTNKGVTSILGARFIGVPDGTSKEFKIEGRKVTESLGRVYTSDDGATWTASNTWDSDFESSSNSTTQNPTADVYLCSYTTPAYALESSDLVPFDDAELSEVIALNYNIVDRGALICSNFTGFVPTNTTSPAVLNAGGLKGWANLNDDKTLYSGNSYKPSHDTISLGGTSNGVKFALFEYADDNGLVWPVVISKQMIYDTTWGDNDKFDITDGIKADVPDNNGNYPVYGTFISKYPIGFKGA